MTTMDIGIKGALAKILRYHRKARRMSQAELSSRSGLHINTIHHLERGVHDLKFTTWLFLAKGLDIDEITFLKLLLEEYYEN